MNQKPLVSIIIPVYKAEQYLQQCLNSVLCQTYENLEIICVNDGSPDRCLEILQNYKYQDPRVKIIDQSNEGVSAARNKALESSSGEYIVFVDADDWIDKNTIENALDAVETHNVDAVLWSYISEHGHKSEVRPFFDRNMLFEGDQIKQFVHRRFVGIIGLELSMPERADILCPVWGKLYKRNLIDGIRFVSLEKIGTYEDGLFNLEVFGRAKRIYYITNPMYHYRRINVYAQTSFYRPKLHTQWQYLFLLLKEYIENNGLGQEYYDALSNRISLSILGLGINIEASSLNFFQKAREINSIISTDQYKQSSSHLSLSYFPFKWKIFYFCAKHGLVIPLHLMLKVIRKLVTS